MTPPIFDDTFRTQLRDLLAWRRDVRRFRPDPLPAGTLERLIGSACFAPSVGLSQPWRFVIVESSARRTAILEIFRRCNQEALDAQAPDRAEAYARLKLAGLREAPAHLAVFAEETTDLGHGLGRRTMPETAAYSVVTAIAYLWLAARAEGVGMGWISILDPAGVREALETPPTWRLVGYFCLGYPEREHPEPELEIEAWEHRRPSAAFVVRR